MWPELPKLGVNNLEHAKCLLIAEEAMEEFQMLCDAELDYDEEDKVERGFNSLDKDQRLKFLVNFSNHLSEEEKLDYVRRYFRIVNQYQDTYGSENKVEEVLVDEPVYEGEPQTKPTKRKIFAMSKLEELVGLDTAKQQVNKLLAFIEIARMRKQHGLKSKKQSLHMMFKGNPGTGKTTLARILGEIFKEIGVLEKGHVVEVDRSSFVSMYQGEGEKKMIEMVNKAEGGILFIDEIYGLYDKDDGKDQGKHIITALLKLIEDRSDKFICIGAGYTNEVNTFLNSNPGLLSRFPIHIDFEDYSTEQLIQIADNMFTSQDYTMDNTFVEKFTEIVEEEKQSKNFGNGRVVRNIVEAAIRDQSNRLFNSDLDLNKEDLMTIKGEDFNYTPIELNIEENEEYIMKRFMNFMKEEQKEKDAI